MSTFWKWVIILLAWLAFSLSTFQFCLKERCCGAGETTEQQDPPPPAPPAETRYPIDFEHNLATAYTNDGFDNLRSGIISDMGEDNQLIITGRYYNDEAAPEGFASMGKARAAQLRDLLAPDIPADRVVLSDLNLGDRPAGLTKYFEAVNHEWQAADAEEEAKVVELDDRILIHFPYNSSIKEADPKVDDYLTKLAERLRATNERVQLTGHTDNRGSADGNMRLSERRAKFIRDILIRKGVAADRIVVDWKGLTTPISSNDTEAGRRNNRRVEVRLLGN